jgi:hypothetical protein
MVRKHGRVYSIFFLLGVAAVLTTAGRAGTTVVQEPGTISASQIQPLADGTKNPQSISDAAALRVVFLSIADPTDTPRLRARFGRMQLNEGDMTILFQKLGGLHGLVTAQRARIAAAKQSWKGGSSTFENVAALDRQLDTFAANAYGELLGSLSPEGAVKLQEHVNYVKTRIKILPQPKMAASHH